MPRCTTMPSSTSPRNRPICSSVRSLPDRAGGLSVLDPRPHPQAELRGGALLPPPAECFVGAQATAELEVHGEPVRILLGHRAHESLEALLGEEREEALVVAACKLDEQPFLGGEPVEDRAAREADLSLQPRHRGAFVAVPREAPARTGQDPFDSLLLQYSLILGMGAGLYKQYVRLIMLAVADERINRYAELLVDTCLGVQPGWQVVVYGTPEGRPLVEAIVRTIGRRDAYALLRVTFGGNAGGPRQWVAEAPLERLREAPSLELHTLLHADALIVVEAPENTRDGTAIGIERLQALQEAMMPVTERVTRHEVAWVGCQFPTPALAQEAGMSTDEFAEFLYAACLLDWGAERDRMQKYADLFGVAAEVRIVGDDTDLTLGVEGRSMLVDAGGANIPGGEIFCSPVEDSASGTIAFTEFPAVYQGRELRGIRLRFEGGRVVEASAETNEQFLLETLDTDDGARRLGELGIGCNPGITRYMRNTLFDEKIDGTAHVALGKGFPHLRGEQRVRGALGHRQGPAHARITDRAGR